jgi:hypothetical protein
MSDSILKSIPLVGGFLDALFGGPEDIQDRAGEFREEAKLKDLRERVGAADKMDEAKFDMPLRAIINPTAQILNNM